MKVLASARLQMAAQAYLPSRTSLAELKKALLRLRELLQGA